MGKTMKPEEAKQKNKVMLVEFRLTLLRIKHQKQVAKFMESEGLNNLSPALLKCPRCDVEFDSGTCPNCGKDAGAFPVEPFLSSQSCDVCGTPLAGNRYSCNGWSERDQCVKEYEHVCEDCVQATT